MKEKEKRIFKIKIDNIPEDEIEDYIKDVMKKIKETPRFEVPDIDFMNIESDPDPKMDLEYLTSKRDDALEHFNEKLKSHLLTNEELHTRLDTVLRINKQVKMMEDALVIHEVAKNKKK